ncbi:acyl-CoA carboxylase subunit beta [Corynebacterium kalidii]|jgi:acetyl-CoA carboxylase carboxyltransferase component|uniref:Acyl-CoA carboxylase subunit beta n=1 Tax=Corynebacterium kalidii TaxID=2931982 RepID=A0A9X1WFY0_9CORY|nr:carboxyl transferase domain-containing protein [Corynebacterium kalidii]MCJ7857736.1 acyl-CoA carboxylase subunit beta [Corynebacterium kalidii]
MTAPSAVVPTSEEYRANRASMEEKLGEIREAYETAFTGGGEKSLEKLRGRGKMTPRERIDSVIDRGSPFLELCTMAGYGTDFTVGGSVVGGIGTVEGVDCLIVANDPTVKGGASNEWTLRKCNRLQEIAVENRLPVLTLVESGGADLRSQKEVFVPGGAMFRAITQASKAGVPTIAIVYGNCTAGGAYIPGMSDHVVMVKERSKVFLAGPPLVKAATGEVTDDESLGGAQMHTDISGLGDYLAVDELDAARIGRSIVRRLNWRRKGQTPATDVAAPVLDEEELLGIVPDGLKVPYDPYEIIGRFVDGSEFDEFKPRYGSGLVTGWAQVHGYPVGILANSRGVLFSEEAQKATQFIQLANKSDTPLIFMHNTTGYMVGREYEEGGIIKHGAMMINAVSNSEVPHISLITAASYGAGHYGMCGRAFNPRFVFAWPSARSAVMGSEQLASVVSSISAQSARARGLDYTEDAEKQLFDMLKTQADVESAPLKMSGMLYDDGIIDPRDTRSVVGMALSAIHSGPVEGTDAFGVFRM